MKFKFENLMAVILVLCVYLVFFKQVALALALILSAFIFYSSMRIIIFIGKFFIKSKILNANVTKISVKKYSKVA